MKKVSTTTLARRIARVLFTAGNGVRAKRMQLHAWDAHQRHTGLGGWSEAAAAAQIRKVLREAGL